METRANYLLVGFFVIAVVFGLIGAILWKVGAAPETAQNLYDIRFTSSVTGLRETSPVRYKGVHVGQVMKVDLDPENPGVVVVTVQVREAAPVSTNTIATLELEGLTGGRYVLLSDDPDATGTPGPLPEPDKGNPLIAARASSIEALLAGAPEVLDNINAVLGKAQELMVNASNILSAENVANVGRTIESIATFSDALAGRSDDLASLIDDASGTMENLRSATQTLEELATDMRSDTQSLIASAESLLASGEQTLAAATSTLQTFEEMAVSTETKVGGTLDAANSTLGSFQGMAESVDEAVVDISGQVEGFLGEMQVASSSLANTARQMELMIAENREPIRDFSATGLYELTTLLAEMRELIVVLNRVTTEVARDPARFLFGDQQQGYEPGAQ